MKCWSDADQKCPLLMLHAIFSYAFLFLAALCCQLTLTRLLRSRYDACVILTRSRRSDFVMIIRRDSSRTIVSFGEGFGAGLALLPLTLTFVEPRRWL